MAENIVEVTASGGVYPIRIGADILSDVGKLVGETLSASRAFVLSDAHVAPLYLASVREALEAAGVPVSVHTVPPGEASKAFATLESVLEAMNTAGCDRWAVLVALGGGVICDLGGFAAAVHLRGIRVVQVPTSLLAQVDSSVGGKTGINTPWGKNLVGAFHQPAAVVTDVRTLETLPPREVRAGYAEVVKTALLAGGEFWAWIKANGEKVVALKPEDVTEAVTQCCRIKAGIVTQDERESGLRAVLNLGHTFAHAIEAQAGYDGRVIHGEAVAVGLTMAAHVSVAAGVAPAALETEIRRHLEKTGLPVVPADLPVAWDVDDLVHRLGGDKKVRNGRPVFVLLQAAGRPFLAEEVDPDLIRDVFETMCARKSS